MKRPKIIGVLGIILTLYFLMACATTSTNRTKELERIAAKNPNDAKAQYDLGRHLISETNNLVQTVVAFEKALSIDPDYRVTEQFLWTPEMASTFGISVTENLIFGNFSLFFFLGFAYHDGVTTYERSNSSSVIGFEENERVEALEKSLASFRRGYEIDIEGGKNTDKNLKTVYLGYIAKVLDLLDRKDETAASYRELSYIATVTPEIAQRFNISQTPAVVQGSWWNRAPEFAQLSSAQLQSKFPGKNVIVQGQEVLVDSFPVSNSISRFMDMFDPQGKVDMWVVYFPSISSDADKIIYERLIETFTVAYGEPINEDTYNLWAGSLPKGVFDLVVEIGEEGVSITWTYF